MHIILINHYAGSPEMGMEYRPYYLARQWVRAGYEVSIIAADQSHIRKKNPDIAYDFSEEFIDGIRYVWVRTPKYEGNGAMRAWNMIRFTSKLWFNALRLAQTYKPDVVVASSTYTIDNYAALKIARIAGAQYYYEVHDLWPLSPMELGGMKASHPFIRMMQAGENYAYKYCDKVISMLPHTQEHMQAHGLDLKKWRYIPNGICKEEWAQAEAIPEMLATEIKKMKTAGKRLIAYAGTLGLANALDNLIEAAAITKNKDAEFLIFGIGPEEEHLRQIIEEKKLSNVRLMGSVPKTVIPNLLAEMDILYIGLQRQSLFRFGISPNKLIDYMMAAKPVIQAIEAGNDMVSEANCGISIEPENPQALAHAVDELLQKSDDELQQMGDRGKEFVLARHTYEKLAEEFVDIILEDV
jgi:glycosyltransferase involved in cell wall biosynthesis